MVTIDVKDVVESQLNYTLDVAQSVYIQTGLVADFTATIDNVDYPFRVIRSGVANLADTAANWLKLHFLTWQPRVKSVTYYSPEWLTYYAVDSCTIKLKATYPDKTTRVITLYSCPAGSAVTLNLQYSVVAGKLGNTYPSYYEVWTESGGTKLSESQLYTFSDVLSEDEQWYLFENSLGGLDIFRASGTNNLNAEHEYNIAEFSGVKEEYQVDTERKYTKNTGYLDEYSRRWLLDFFPSRAKYVYESTAIRKIVVTESNVTYISNDLPSSYTFSWQLSEVSPFLNLIKNESDIPDNLVAPDLSSPDFIIPPRLAEYPRVELTEGVLIPAFDPFNPKPGVTSFGAIHDTIKNSVVKELEEMLPGPGGGGGTDIEIIETNDLTAPTDKNVYSAARTDKEIKESEAEVEKTFLNKITTAKQLVIGEVNFKSNLKTEDWLFIGDFIKSMIAGKGAGFDKDGNGQVESLEVRSYMKVMELIFNRLSAMEGDFSFTESGTIEAVELTGKNTYVLTLRRRWEMDFTAFDEHDIIYGVVNNLLTSGEYYTSWMRVIHKDTSANQLTIVVYPDNEVPAKRNFAPVKSMNLTRRGNAFNKQRQDAWYISSYEGCIMYLQGVGKPILEENNYALTVGKPKHLDLFNGLPINYDHPYLFARGAIIQDLFRVDYQGRPVQDIIDRGLWRLDIAISEPYRNIATEAHESWHNSCKYRCIVDQTQQEPRWNATDWLMVSGDPTLRLELDSSNGLNFMAGQVDTVISALVYKGVSNISADIQNADWEWTRETDDPVSDTLWNSNHANSTSNIHITDADMGLNAFSAGRCTFTCTAYVRDINNTRIEQIRKTFDI